MVVEVRVGVLVGVLGGGVAGAADVGVAVVLALRDDLDALC